MLLQSLSKTFLNISKQNVRFLAQVVNKDIIYEKLGNSDKGIAVIGFNRPNAKNALSFNVVEGIENSLNSIENDKEVRVAIIRSHVPGIFCAGADLKERLKLSETQVSEFVTRLRSLFTHVDNLSIPVIAAIDGVAVGGGLEIALSCDIRTASNKSRLGLVETKLALIPGAGGTQRLPRIINPSLAKELIYTSRILSGEEAKNLGIVNHVIEQNESGDAAYLKALDIAREILPNGPFAIKMAKEAINRGLDVDLQAALQFEEACYAKIIPTKDRIEGLKAFNEKRKPQYRGE